MYCFEMILGHPNTLLRRLTRFLVVFWTVQGVISTLFLSPRLWISSQIVHSSLPEYLRWEIVTAEDDDLLSIIRMDATFRAVLGPPHDWSKPFFDQTQPGWRVLHKLDVYPPSWAWFSESGADNPSSLVGASPARTFDGSRHIVQPGELVYGVDGEFDEHSSQGGFTVDELIRVLKNANSNWRVEISGAKGEGASSVAIITAHTVSFSKGVYVPDPETEEEDMLQQVAQLQHWSRGQILRKPHK